MGMPPSAYTRLQRGGCGSVNQAAIQDVQDPSIVTQGLSEAELEFGMVLGESFEDGGDVLLHVTGPE